MELENPQLLRILGHRLIQFGYHDLGIAVFKEVLTMRQEEPQSYRNLGLAYHKKKMNQRAVDNLYEVVRKTWDSRFPDIQIIALIELNNILSQDSALEKEHIDPRFIKPLDVDVRVILTWDADLTDMDLWVTDPLGEKCYYSHKDTRIGGKLSQDFTQGYGPEEFMLHRAMPGKYKVEVNYYGNSQQVLSGATTVQMQLFLNYGRKNQEVKEVTLRLKNNKEVVLIGEFDIQF